MDIKTLREKSADELKAHLIDRHGREDFTIVTQEEMLKTLSNILNVLTMAVGALGGISLLVGGVGIVTIMTIAVAERTGEIGLLVALGAPRRTILGLFLGEAAALAALGRGQGEGRHGNYYRRPMKIKTRSKKVNKAWLHDHLTDPYVKLAQKEGYRARAAYKLKEIDEALVHLAQPTLTDTTEPLQGTT